MFIISHLISILTKGSNKEHKKTSQKPAKKSTIDIPQPESSPTDEIPKYKHLMENLKPYHNNKKDILITIADIGSTLEQARDLTQNIAFDTTRVSQSASCIRTSLDEINYTYEKLQQSYQVVMRLTLEKIHHLTLNPLITCQNNFYISFYAC